MKTLVSVADNVFEGVERLARRTKKSLRRLVTETLREYLERHAPKKVTESMNKACAEIPQAASGEQDAFTSAAGRRTLKRLEW